jgi:sortase A
VNVRRSAGFALAGAGALLLAFSGGQYALGAVQADRARQAWDESSAQSAVASAFSGAAVRARPAAIEGAPVARLLIPRLGLDEIVLEGVDGADLNGGPGHVPGSAFPGETGNSVISAHRDRHFNKFDRLQIGDTITTESGARATKWVVVSARVIDKDAPALFRTADATLTLTTCWPIRYFGTAPERLIVTAKPVGSPAVVRAAERSRAQPAAKTPGAAARS